MPYWMAGMGVAGGVAESAQLGQAAHKALNIATGALIQGTYDAAKAPDGQRFAQGFQGAAGGAAMVGAFELAGPLWKFLKTGGLSDETAKAVEKTAQGIAGDTERSLAAKAMVENPELESKIGEWTSAQAAGTKAAGIPQDTLVGSPDKGVRISVVGSDGKPYAQMPVEQVPMDNLVSHLKAGGQIQAMEGDPVEIQRFLSKVEVAAKDAFKLEGVNGELVANDTIIAGPRTADTGGYEKLWKEFEPTHPMKEDEYVKLWKDMDTTRQEAEGVELLGQPVQFGQSEIPIEGTRGKIKFRAVEMEDVPPSERPLRTSDKDLPLYHRIHGGYIDETPNVRGETWFTEPGQTPKIELPTNLAAKEAPGIIHHEMIHAHANYLDIHEVISSSGDNQISRSIYNGAIAGRGVDYPAAHSTEEVFAYVSAAIRTGNQRAIEGFAEADSGKASVFNWYTQTANAIREHTATLPDSLHKRTLERRLNYTVAQASKQLEDLRRPFSQTHGIDVDSASGLHYADDLKTGVRQWAPDRESLLRSMEPNQEPLNTPELVDYSNLPPVPRYAVDLEAHTVARAPITTDPPHLRQVEPNLGPLALSNFFRPFYDWVGSVGKKMERPDLVSAFESIRDAQTTKFNTMRPMMQTLDETLYKYPHSRQVDFYKYYEATTPEAKATVAQGAGFSKEELFALRRFETQFDTLPGFREYVHKTIPEMRDNKWDVETRFPKSLDSNEDNSAMIGRLMRRGQLDPRDQNLLRVASTYLNGHTFHEVVEPLIKNAERIVDEQTVAGGYEFDILRPMLRRQIQYYRGVPDWSQKVVMSAVDTAVQNINKGITSVNKGLPSGMQIPTMKEGPRDILGKFILFNYAGALALRPAVPIRDTLSIFMTAYPLLGEEYLWKGMKKAMTFMGEGKTGDAFQIAEQNGWLMNKTTLPEMIAAGGERQSGPVSKWTEKAMSVMTLSENSKRLAAGWGFAEKIGDAVHSFASHGDKDKFIKESGLWFLGPARRDLRVGEAARLTAAGSREGIDGWALKAAKDMVDATNWDFSSGAAPGIYKYQLGRLFGQYGQWPMNYIEYARKFANHITTSGQRAEAIKGMSRLMVAHGAVLAAANSVGIDAAQWTFTQPMAYGGGPLFNAVVNIPNTMDFETYQGTQARREVIHPVWPGAIPGSNAVRGIWKAIAEDKDDVWIRILGFQPTKEVNE